MRPRGFTLLETLASLAILGAFIVAAGAWLVTSARASRSLTAEASGRMELGRVLAAIRADLDEADPSSITITDGALELVTAHTLPGETRGWTAVRWRLDRDGGALERRATATIAGGEAATSTAPAHAAFRTALRGVAAFEIAWVDEPTDEPIGAPSDAADDEQPGGPVAPKRTNAGSAVAPAPSATEGGVLQVRVALTGSHPAREISWSAAR